MDISKVGIDTMGVADNPKYEKDDERDIYFESAFTLLKYGADLLPLLSKHLNEEELTVFEGILFNAYVYEKKSPLSKLVENVITKEAERLTIEKFGY